MVSVCDFSSQKYSIANFAFRSQWHMAWVRISNNIITRTIKVHRRTRRRARLHRQLHQRQLLRPMVKMNLEVWEKTFFIWSISNVFVCLIWCRFSHRLWRIRRHLGCNRSANKSTCCFEENAQCLPVRCCSTKGISRNQNALHISTR